MFIESSPFKRASGTRLLFILLTITLPNLAGAQIYKFRDANGKWQYSDQKPASSTLKVETIAYRSPEKKLKKPSLELRPSDRGLEYIVNNPYFAPIQAFLRTSQASSKQISKIIPANTSVLMHKKIEQKISKEHDFYYVLGSPDARHSQQLYLPPFKDFRPMKVTQGFKGRFSHHRQPSLYAIDIGMPVGTRITAVRKGTVIYTKDDYALAGVSSVFFIDKANVVKVLHDDGTYAVYAHLLLGSAKVKPGQLVEAGELLALSGNTGYSTGPHLHFAIRENTGGKTHSLPFKLLQKESKLKPKQGMWLLPAEN